MESDHSTESDSVSDDAAAIAGGSAIVMAGGIGERGLRMVTTWFLSGALGAGGFGLYAFATTVVGIAGALAPLGMDAGLTMYGARYRASQERAKLKGTLMSALGTVALSAPAGAVLAYACVDQGWVLSDRPAEAEAVAAISAAIALSAILASLVAVLISAKDMVGQALASQLAVPGVTLIGALIAVGSGAGTGGVIQAFVWAHAFGVALALHRVLRQDGSLLRDRNLTAAYEPRALFAYALPQSFARILYRANLWVDILMLTALASLVDVGVYRVSVAIAMLGALPVMASTTMFGPVIAELVYTDRIERLNALLKVVTRWLVVISTPLYVVVLLLPDVILSIFDEAYLPGAQALGVLMIGQALYVACAPTGAILTNAGHSMLNLVNGVVSVSLNIGLNALLIPEHGIMGAAMASATALSVWSLLRLFQVRALHNCWPFEWRIVAAILVIIGLATGMHIGLEGAGLAVRIPAVAMAIAVGLALFWRFGRTEADEEVLNRVRARLGHR